jgi:hypothetical protein
MHLLYMVVVLSLPLRTVEGLAKRAMPRLSLPYATYEAANYSDITDVRSFYVSASTVVLIDLCRYIRSKIYASQRHLLGNSAGRSRNHHSSSLRSRMDLSDSFAHRACLPR